MSTPITCAKTGEVNLRACLKQPFLDYTLFASRAPNLGGVYLTGISDAGGPTLTGYVSYIDNGTNQSLKSNTTDYDESFQGGYYTGAKFMAFTVTGLEYQVGVTPHTYADADNTSAAAMTITNVGHAGVAIPQIGGFPVGFNFKMCGPSLAGGDEMSWFEDQSTELHFLTSDGASLTRQQAFEITDETEGLNDYAGHAFSWLSDGESIWLLSTDNIAPQIFRLVRFTPTAIGDPFDYEKFTLTFDDANITTEALETGIYILATTDNTFIVEIPAYKIDGTYIFGRVKHLEVTKDGTGYTEYFVTGSEACADFCANNSIHLTKTASGAPRLYTQSYGVHGETVGTYDLTCTGNQGHVYAKKRTLGPPIITTGNLIPSGDMNAGSDVFKASGDMGPGNMLWKETK